MQVMRPGGLKAPRTPDGQEFTVTRELT